MSNKEYDVIVIGGSMPGYQTAIQAAKNGLSTAIIEENRIGGIQTMAAEMPLRTLLNNDKILQECIKASERGLSFSGASFDPESFYESIKNDADQFSKQLVDNLRELDVDVYLGESTVKDDHTVTIEREGSNPRELSWKKLVFADEPVTKIPEAIDRSVKGYYTLENFGLLDTLPNGLIIYGSGEKALQAALVWAGLGSEVYLISPEDTVLSDFSEEVQDRYQKELEKRDVKLYLGNELNDVFQDSAGVFHVEIIDPVTDIKKNLTGSELMILDESQASDTGIKELDLEKKNGWIITDENFKTSNDDVYTWTGSESSLNSSDLTQLASEYIADILADKNIEPFDFESDYKTLMLNPFYASIGIVDKDELEDEEVVYGTYPEDVSVNDEGDFLEIIIDPEFGEILGAQAIGNNAEGLISSISMIMDSEGSAFDLDDVYLPENSDFNILKKAIDSAKRQVNNLG